MSIRAITSSGLPFFLGSARQMGLLEILDFVTSITFSVLEETLDIDGELCLVPAEVVDIHVDVDGVEFTSTFWDMPVDASTINVSVTIVAFEGVEDSVQVGTEVPRSEVVAAETVVLGRGFEFVGWVIRSSSCTVPPSCVVRSSCFARSGRL